MLSGKSMGWHVTVVLAVTAAVVGWSFGLPGAALAGARETRQDRGDAEQGGRDVPRAGREIQDNGDGPAQAPPGRVLYKLKPGASPAQIGALNGVIRARGLAKVRTLKGVGIEVARAAQGSDKDVCADLVATGAVLFAEPDALVAPVLIPNDPNYGMQWQHAKIDSPGAWDITTGSSSILAAVCDTGVDSSHPDLAANLKLPGYNSADGTQNTEPVYAHGTGVAGCIGAVGNNGIGVAGGSWTVKILPIRITNNSVTGSAYISDAVAGIEYAADRGAKVVNLSYGMAHSSSIDVAGQYLRETSNGLLFVSASNDNQDPGWPDFPNFVAVGATDKNDDRSSFSNYGAYIDCVAPGSSVHMTWDHWSGYSTRSGTSFASPIAAGLATLVYAAAPSSTPTQVESFIFSNCVDLGDVGEDNVFGHGRIDAGATLAKVFMLVTESTPAGGDVVTTPPTDFVVTFSNPVDSTTLEAGDLTVNGTPANSVALSADRPTATFTFNTSPVTTEGEQMMHMAAGAVATSSPDPADPLLREWNGAFHYDTHRMAVVSTAPATDGSTFEAPLTRLEVTVDEAYDTSSAGVDDLVLSQGAVVSVDTSLAGSNTVVYTLDGFMNEGTLNVEMPAGALTDIHGNPMLPYSGTMDLDFGTVALRTPVSPVMPWGSLIYLGSASGSITTGDTDSFTLDIDPGQTVTVIVEEPDPSLKPTVTLTGGAIGSDTAAGPGMDAVIQSAATSGGAHTISVSGGGTAGAYTLRVFLNAAAEYESWDGSANDDMASAQDIDASFIALADGAQRGAAVGYLRPMTGTAVHSEGFEPGSLGEQWSTYSSTVNGRIELTGQHGTASGSHALLMDCDPGGSNNLNEAIWTVDLSGKTKAILSFWHAEWSDDEHAFARNNFKDHLNADGIAIRDGSQPQAKWYPIFDVPNMPNGRWFRFDIDLAARAAARGVSLSNSFQIKFQQYDDEALPSDGRGWDDIAIRCPEDPTQEENQDWYAFTLGAAAPVTLVLTHWGYGDAHLELYDATGTKVADGGGSPSNVDEVIETTLSPGTHYALVSGNHFFSTAFEVYSLVVATGARFDREDNSELGQAQDLDIASGSAVALGHVSSGAETGAEPDFYKVTLSAGDQLAAATSTPADGDGEFLNELNPMLRLYDESGTEVKSDDDNGVGQNAHLTYTVPADGAGSYYIKVLASDADGVEPTLGEYVLTLELVKGPGITVSPTAGLITTEAGGTDTFTVVLNSQPTANVTIGLSSSDTSEGTVSPASVTFTPANWNQPQTVTVTGEDDTIEDGDKLYTILTAPAASADPDYGGLDATDVDAANLDDDAPSGGVTVVSVTARDVRLGGKYNITASIRNDAASAVTIHVDCEVEDSAGGVQGLTTRVATIAPGETANVKFNDYSDSSKVSAGQCTAWVTVQEDPTADGSDTFRLK